MIRLFLADADLKRAIVDGVLRREQSIDFKLAERVPLEGLPDLEVLDIAALEQSDAGIVREWRPSICPSAKSSKRYCSSSMLPTRPIWKIAFVCSPAL